MADNISTYLPDDEYKPSISKPSLQQYDNYQIYSVYCEDIVYSSLPASSNIPIPVKQRNFLAVQSMSPSGLIKCNFSEIVDLYP